MTQATVWLRFEQGTEADLEIFLAGVLPGHPVRPIRSAGLRARGSRSRP